MRIVSTLALLVLTHLAAAEEATSPLVPSGPSPEVDDSAIGFETPAAALDALRNKPSTEVREERGWTIIQDRESEKVLALWSFTPQDHPAHPAAVKRIITERDGAIFLEMRVSCGGTKADCEALVRDFQALNNQIRADIRAGGT